MDITTNRLTLRQAEGLRRIRDSGPEAWAYGRNRAGGAVGRMFDAMSRAGLCTAPPHRITQRGRMLLADYERSHRSFRQ